MAQLVNSQRFELEEIGRSISSLSRRSSSLGIEREGNNDEYELQWAAIERLSTFERIRKSVVGGDEEKERKVVDVTKLGALEGRLLIDKLIKHIENDNLRLFGEPSFIL